MLKVQVPNLKLDALFSLTVENKGAYLGNKRPHISHLGVGFGRWGL